MKPDLVKIREAIEDVIEDDHDDGLALAAVIVDRVVGPLHAERDAFKAAIEQVRRLCEKYGQGRLVDRFPIFALRHILAALDAPETPENGDWLKNLADMSLAAAREKFGPTFAPETPGDGPAKHIGGRANAEDCPACRPEIDKTVLYPYICPGEPETPGDAETGQRHEPPSPIYCRAEHPFGEHNEDTHICQGFPAHPDFGLGHACRCGFKWPAHSSGDAG